MPIIKSSPWAQQDAINISLYSRIISGPNRYLTSGEIAGGSGSVTSITGGENLILQPSPITTTGSIGLNPNVVIRGGLQVSGVALVIYSDNTNPPATVGDVPTRGLVIGDITNGQRFYGLGGESEGDGYRWVLVGSGSIQGRINVTAHDTGDKINIAIPTAFGTSADVRLLGNVQASGTTILYDSVNPSNTLNVATNTLIVRPATQPGRRFQLIGSGIVYGTVTFDPFDVNANEKVLINIPLRMGAGSFTVGSTGDLQISGLNNIIYAPIYNQSITGANRFLPSGEIATGGGLGTVTSLVAGSNIVLNPSPITTTGSIGLAANLNVTDIQANGDVTILGDLGMPHATFRQTSYAGNSWEMTGSGIATGTAVFTPLLATDRMILSGMPLYYEQPNGVFDRYLPSGELGAGAGTVTNIVLGSNLSSQPNPITTTGSIGLANNLNIPGNIQVSGQMIIYDTPTASTTATLKLRTLTSGAASAWQTTDIITSVAGEPAGGNIYGVNSLVQTRATAASYTGAILTGVLGESDHFGSATVGTAYGIQGQVANINAGTITDARALYATTDNLGAGTITTAYGVYIDTLAGSRRYGVYQAGAADTNYCAGPSQFSDTQISGTTILYNNLEFVGTGLRLRGDFSNATRPNRLTIQSNIVDGHTSFSIMPNGTSDTAIFVGYNSSDPNNASRGIFGCYSDGFHVDSDYSGAGQLLPIFLMMKGQRVFILSSGLNFQISGMMLHYEPIYHAIGGRYLPSGELGVGGTGTVTNIALGSNLSMQPSPITTTGSIGLANSLNIPGDVLVSGTLQVFGTVRGGGSSPGVLSLEGGPSLAQLELNATGPYAAFNTTVYGKGGVTGAYRFLPSGELTAGGGSGTVTTIVAGSNIVIDPSPLTVTGTIGLNPNVVIRGSLQVSGVPTIIYSDNTNPPATVGDVPTRGLVVGDVTNGQRFYGLGGESNGVGYRWVLTGSGNIVGRLSITANDSGDTVSVAIPTSFSTAANVRLLGNVQLSGTNLTHTPIYQGLQAGPARYTVSGELPLIIGSVKAFGATGDGVTDDRAAIQLALDSAMSPVYFPSGVYYLASGLVVTHQGQRLIGAGRLLSVLKTDSTLYDTIQVVGSYCSISDLHIHRNTVTATAGAGIHFFGGAAGLTVDNVVLQKNYYNFQAENANIWTVSRSYLVTPIQYSIYIGPSLTNPDSGDNGIIDNVFDTAGSPAAAIRQEVDGGTRVVGNKILSHQIGYDLSVPSGVVTSVLLIDANSIESQGESFIRLRPQSFGGQYGNIVISNNEFAGTPSSYGISISGGTGIHDIAVLGNVFYAIAPVGVNVQGADTGLIANNSFNQLTTAISIDTQATNWKVGPNLITNATTPYVNNSSTSRIIDPQYAPLYGSSIAAANRYVTSGELKAGAGTGTVTNIALGSNLSMQPSPITVTGSIGLANSLSIPGDMQVSGNSMVYGGIGIGGPSPTAGFYQLGQLAYFENDSYGGTTNTGGIITFRAARAKFTAPSGLLSGDVLGRFQFQGYTGSAYSTRRAGIQAVASENWTATNQGAYVFFETTPVGSTTVAERLRIESFGIIMASGYGGAAAPGAGKGMLRFEKGTNAGTLKLVVYAGTSTTGITITDNIGAGS